jgi:phenylalanyl-tRNA synthetase alpha chain
VTQLLPQGILDKLGTGLHLKTGHPLCTVRKMIQKVLTGFERFDFLSPIVSVENNFDLLRIPKDHPSRRKSDTYYWGDTSVLRTHTSAHQVSLLKDGHRNFVVTGDVYRKDDIDATHYPVFHQMEGVKIVKGSLPVEDLKQTINKILDTLFPRSQVFWKSDYFPFTEPSFEVAVSFEGKELEVLGCGEIHPEVLTNAGMVGARGWAFGLGLERLAMKLFKIPDIRLFWSKDSRFLSQFKDGEITEFKPFSNHPPCYKDVTFWIPEGWNRNALTELVREISGDLVESVEEIDSFEKVGKTSKCYRLNYRSTERTLSNVEVDDLQVRLRNALKDRLNLELR